MAGAGYKLFATGDVLTAAQVNTYLNEQTVMVFASSAARTSALSGVLAEGMMSYLQDTNAVEVYNGSAWVGVSGAGDVTEVQAGTGISVASGTGPIPIVTSTVATTFDAKGDLVVGTGADTFAKLTVGGTNGHTLQVDSSTATGLKWAAAAGGGKVLQVVQGTRTTVTTITSTTYVTTNITATITPSLATSKVLILFSCPINTYRATNETPSSRLAIYDGSTQIYEAWGPYWKIEGPSVSTARSQGEVTGVYLDSPNTTSAKTYTIQGKLDTTSNSAEFNAPTGSFAGGGTIVLMEIGA
jgi:hypothetical protein